MINENYCPTGIVEIYSENNKLLWSGHNMIVKSGRKMILDKCFKNSELDLSTLKIYLINNSNPVEAGESITPKPIILENETKVLNSSNDDLMITFMIGYNEDGTNGNPYVLTENINSLGLCYKTTDNNIIEFSRVIFPQYSAGMKLRFRYKIHF